MDLDSLRALISVIDHGSTQAAAAAMRMSRTTLRRRLEELELTVGVPLLIRGTAGVVPTPAGQALAERGRALTQEATAILHAVRELDRPPEGRLRALVPVGLPPHLIALVLAMARQHLPLVEFQCLMADNPLERLDDELDLVLHFGPPPRQGPWISTQLANAPERLVASPDYLAERGVPHTPADLAKHSLLSWRPPGLDPRGWPLRDGGTLPVTPVFITSDVHLIRQLAAAGQGIALLPDGGLPEGPDISGPLVPVLEGVVGRPNAFRALVPELLIQLPKGRKVMDLLRELVAGFSALT